MRTPRVLLVVLAAACAVIGVAAGPRASHAEGSPIRFTRLLANDTTSDDPVAGVPINFHAAGSFKPPEKDEAPWMGYLWDFGDGETLNSGRIDGSPTHHDPVKTYAKPGIYTVRCTAYHGFSLFGFKFTAPRTITVKVQCGVQDPGPKKCQPGIFTPFTGKWLVIDKADDRLAGELTLTQDSVFGLGGNFAFRVPGLETDVVYDLVTSKIERGAATVFDGVSFDTWQFVAKTKQVSDGDSTLTVRVFFHDDHRLSWRIGSLLLHTPSFDVDAELELKSRTGDDVATVCTNVAAGKKKLKRGDLVSFSVGIESEGHSCVPGGRLALEVTLEGATVLPDKVLGVHLLANPTIAATSIRAGVGSLGGTGRRPKDAEAKANLVFAAQVDANATFVRCTVKLTDPDPSLDRTIVTTVLPTDRVLCLLVDPAKPE